MNINESLRDWIESRISNFTTLTDVALVTMGETGDLAPPFLAIYETSADMRETNGVIMTGVSDYQIFCDLHTVPADEDNDGTTAEDERAMRRDFYDILGDRDAIDWMSGRNEWTVFDIRAAGPTSEPSDGRRISRWTLQITACPAQ